MASTPERSSRMSELPLIFAIYLFIEVSWRSTKQRFGTLDELRMILAGLFGWAVYFAIAMTRS